MTTGHNPTNSLEYDVFDLVQTLPKHLDAGGHHHMDLPFSVAVDAAASGLGMYATPENRRNPKIGPITCLPSPYPRKTMEMARFLAPVFSFLMDQVAQDREWIYASLEKGNVLSSDSFIGDLAKIMMETTDGAAARCTLFRHDFMLHQPNGKETPLHPLGFVPMKNVEFNTVSVGLAYLTDRAMRIHDRAIHRLISSGAWPKVSWHSLRHQGSPCCDFVKAMRDSIAVYESSSSSHDCDMPLVAIMVTESAETNSLDQYGLWNCLANGCRPSEDSNRTVGCRRAAPLQRQIDYLFNAYKNHRLIRDENDRLILSEEDVIGKLVHKEVALIYWRVFYHPRHVEGPDKAQLMEFRRLIEGSVSIKVPSVAMQLAGVKEVQKLLSDRSNLERFLPLQVFNDSTETQTKILDLILDVTARQVEPLSDPDLLERVMTTEKFDWVLKPQREGGGNNLFDEAMVEKLKELKASNVGGGKSGYVLMELIRPPTHTSIACSIGTLKTTAEAIQADSELGIFSTLVIKNSDTTPHTTELRLEDGSFSAEFNFPCAINSNSGVLLRTKPKDVKEGGVHAGFGLMDSPLLFDDIRWTNAKR